MVAADQFNADHIAGLASSSADAGAVPPAASDTPQDENCFENCAIVSGKCPTQ